MTKTLAVLSILVPITVPTYCAMLDLQIGLRLKPSEVCKSGPKPPPNLPDSLSQNSHELMKAAGVLPVIAFFLLYVLESKIHSDPYWSNNQKSDKLCNDALRSSRQPGRKKEQTIPQDAGIVRTTAKCTFNVSVCYSCSDEHFLQESAG